MGNTYPFDLYEIVNMIGFDKEIIDGFEADVLGL
jgi:hypothetical protein